MAPVNRQTGVPAWIGRKRCNSLSYRMLWGSAPSREPRPRINPTDADLRVEVATPMHPASYRVQNTCPRATPDPPTAAQCGPIHRCISHNRGTSTIVARPGSQDGRTVAGGGSAGQYSGRISGGSLVSGALAPRGSVLPVDGDLAREVNPQVDLRGPSGLDLNILGWAAGAVGHGDVELAGSGGMVRVRRMRGPPEQMMFCRLVRVARDTGWCRKRHR